jgi:DNA-binding response OmpR family regulator
MSAPQNNSHKSVLLIDDELSLLFILERVLRGAGHSVECAENGKRGLERFHEGSWDAVILDRAMPEMNGEEVAKAIKSTSPNVPLVMITGFPAAVTRPELFDSVLGKPFRPNELLSCLDQVWQRRTAVLSAG